MRSETGRSIGLALEFSDEREQRVSCLRVVSSPQLEPRRVVRHGAPDAAPKLMAHSIS